MKDVQFDNAHFYEPDGLTLSTSGCGCCADYYSSRHSYEPWKVSLESLEKYVKEQRESLDDLAEFVAKQRAEGKTEYTCEGE